MKKILYLALLAIPAQSFAQPTIYGAGAYSIWGMRKTATCSGVAAGPSGASQTWDFSTLVKNDTSTYTYIPVPSGTPLSSVSNLVENDNAGGYTYFSKTSAGMYLVGNIDSTSTPPDVIDYNANTALLMRSTLTYGLNATDIFTDAYSLSGIAFTGGGTISLTVDGWGTLKTPEAVFPNSVRVRVVHDQLDSSTLGVTITMHNVSYQWYDNVHRAPLLQVDSMSINSSITGNVTDESAEYLTKEITTGVIDAAKAAMDMSGNITGNQLVVNGNFTAGNKYHVSLFNLAGQTIFNTEFNGGSKKEVFNINTEPTTGMYIMTVTDVANPKNMNVIKLVKE